MVRLFAHRGFTAESHQENSVASLKEAVARQFAAVEFDIWFVARKLVLKHDEPQKDEVEKLPIFSEYLAYKNKLTYWLDFKNLNEENATNALIMAKNEIELADVKLDQIYFAPFITDSEKAAKIFTKIRNIFGAKAKIIAVCESLKNEKEVRELREFLDRNNVKALSIFHQLIDANFVKTFSGIEIFAWTVNDLNRLQELEALEVKNVATDKITPQIYERKTTSRTS